MSMKSAASPSAHGAKTLPASFPDLSQSFQPCDPRHWLRVALPPPANPPAADDSQTQTISPQLGHVAAHIRSDSLRQRRAWVSCPSLEASPQARAAVRVAALGRSSSRKVTAPPSWGCKPHFDPLSVEHHVPLCAFPLHTSMHSRLPRSRAGGSSDREEGPPHIMGTSEHHKNTTKKRHIILCGAALLSAGS